MFAEVSDRTELILGGKRSFEVWCTVPYVRPPSEARSERSDVVCEEGGLREAAHVYCLPRGYGWQNCVCVDLHNHRDHVHAADRISLAHPTTSLRLDLASLGGRTYELSGI